MLLIKEIGRNSAQLSNSKLSNSKLWLKPVNSVLPLDLSLYIKQQQIDGFESEAIEEVEELKRMTILAMLNGKVNDAPYLAHVGRKVRMTLGDFACILHFSGLSQDRQKAILFSLETGIKPEDVVTLTWPLARKLPHTRMSRAIMDSMTRSMNVNYLFWETFEDFGMVGPLFGLSQDFSDVFSEMQFKEVWKLFREAAPVNTYDDGAEFNALMEDIFKTQL